VYFNVNFNEFFKNKKVHLLVVSELYIYQNAQCKKKKKYKYSYYPNVFLKV